MLNLYVALGSCCYGFGVTADQAIEAAKPNWAYSKIKRPKSEHFTVYKTDSLDTYVDGMGTVYSKGKLEKVQTSSLNKE